VTDVQASDQEGRAAGPAAAEEVYRLDQQIGFLLRQANQRHRAIFAALMIGDLTPRQWAALAKLDETGPCSQNLLGRRTAMDAATIKGVVDRLAVRDLIDTGLDKDDSRRRTVFLTDAGTTLVQRATALAHRITQETLMPLSPAEQATLAELLTKIT
jgi:DNA-binding MarR family transcriptional regulator